MHPIIFQHSFITVRTSYLLWFLAVSLFMFWTRSRAVSKYDMDHNKTTEAITWTFFAAASGALFFDFFGKTLKMMSLDLNKNVQIGKKVKLAVKPTNISIAKNLFGEISLSNQLVVNIKSIENGQLLSSIILEVNDTIFESIITADSSKRMNLQKNEQVTILIKASDLSIMEVLND